MVRVLFRTPGLLECFVVKKSRRRSWTFQIVEQSRKSSCWIMSLNYWYSFQIFPLLLPLLLTYIRDELIETDWSTTRFRRVRLNRLVSSNSSVSIPTGQLSIQSSIVTGDFDEHHRIDLLFGSRQRIGQPIFWIDNGWNNQPDTVMAADIDEDNHSDIVSDNWSNTLSIFFGFGNGTFQSQMIIFRNASRGIRFWHCRCE